MSQEKLKLPLTPIYLLATADIRLVPQKQQDQILKLTCQYVCQNYRFRLPDFQKNAEGGFGWIVVNYLIIAFEPSAVERICHAENLTKLGLKLLDKTDVIPSVFITTWLGYGTTPGS
ncbi:hypothetical protein BY996DRAFT_6458784 [Phakopsora pachyrhizi]|nr:hypothetical protein BY996DRAFT_6458784 [Phakopsora pachyrhizi]